MEVKKITYTIKGKKYKIINYVFEKGEGIIIMKDLNKKNETKKCKRKGK